MLIDYLLPLCVLGVTGQVYVQLLCQGFQSRIEVHGIFALDEIDNVPRGSTSPAMEAPMIVDHKFCVVVVLTDGAYPSICLSLLSQLCVPLDIINKVNLVYQRLGVHALRKAPRSISYSFSCAISATFSFSDCSCDLRTYLLASSSIS